ncbi:MAG: hypothetical protein ABSF60_14200 [Verrucomicrobiota bacterium]
MDQSKLPVAARFHSHPTPALDGDDKNEAGVSKLNGGKSPLPPSLYIQIVVRGFEKMNQALRRAHWAVLLFRYALDWAKYQPGDLVRLNPAILRRVS